MKRFFVILMVIFITTCTIVFAQEQPSEDGVSKSKQEESADFIKKIEGQGIPIATFFMRYARLTQELKLEWRDDTCLDYSYSDYGGLGFGTYTFKTLRIFFAYPSMEIVAVSYNPTFDNEEEKQLKTCAVGYSLRDDYWTDEEFDMFAFSRFYKSEYEAAANASNIRAAVPWGEVYSAHAFEELNNEDSDIAIQFVLTEYINHYWNW